MLSTKYFSIVGAIILVAVMGAAPAARAQSFAPSVNYATGAGPRGVAVGDFNLDGKLDVATANNDDNNVSVLLGKGDGTFITPATSYAAGANPNKIVLGDFNLDGKPDLAVTNQNSNNVSVLLGSGDGTFITPAPVYAVGRNPQSIGTGDFNGDGKPDLVTVNLSAHTLSILSGNGDGTFTALPAVSVPGASSGMTLADFNLDGRPDVVVVNYDISGVSVLLGDGNGSFQNRTDYPLGPGPFSLATGDFNQDGKPDLVVGDQSDGKVYLLIGNGDGSLITPGPAYAVGVTPLALTVGDFTLDGKPDVAAALTTANRVSLLVNQGNATFGTTTPTYLVGQNPSAIAAGDFNRDRKPDIVVTNGSNSNVSILLNTAGPTVSLTSPADNSNFSTGETINLAATASASTGTTIDHVDFYDGANLIGGDATAPYSFQWSNAPPGTHQLIAVATDSSGASASSQPVFVTITGSTATFSISGRVMDESGAGFPGITLKVQGQQINLVRTTQTDERGGYNFDALPGGYDYIVQPSLDGYTFSPSIQSINNLAADHSNINFTAFPIQCTFSLSSSSQHFAAGAGSGFFSLSTQQGCYWRLHSSAPWLNSFSSDGYTNTTISYYVDVNETHAARSAELNIGGQVFEVTQDAAPESCQYDVTPQDVTFGAEGGGGSVQVSVGDGCEWRARSNDFWIRITSGSGERGNGVVSYEVGSNGGVAKSGTMTIAGQTVTIHQQGAASSTGDANPSDALSP